MKLINAEDLSNTFKEMSKFKRNDRTGEWTKPLWIPLMHVLLEINKAETIDATPVIRCEGCKHWSEKGHGYREPWECSHWCAETEPNDYCSFGERRDG